MKNLLFLILFGLSLSACETGKSRKIPETQISREKLAEILVHVKLAESSVSQAMLPHEAGLHRFERYKRKIFSNFEVDTAIFNQNFDYYMNDIEDLEYISRAVNDSLLIRKSRNNF